jgi:uracil-DNA glycosylase
MSLNLPAHWQKIIIEQCEQDYFRSMTQKITEQREQGIEIYPNDEDIYSAFQYVDIEKIKIIILGQDPYHGPNQAHGLAFSVTPNLPVPPSLKNIYKELASDIDDFKIPQHGHLSGWAEQGVLLLNTVLTVQKSKPHSHAKLGWEKFTDEIIANISSVNPHCVFMLWGSHAQDKGNSIDEAKHLVLKAAHPSPLSAYRGFLGCRHFSKADAWLKQKKITPINWQLTENTTLDLF